MVKEPHTNEIDTRTRIELPPGAQPLVHKRLAVPFVVVALLFVVLVGEDIRSRVRAENQLQKTAGNLKPSVTVVHPKLDSVGAEVEIPGAATAYADTPIYARVSGYLKTWHVQIGDRVKSGQILAEIDAPEIDQQSAQAEADLKNARANLSLAEITAQRYRKLIPDGSISQQDFDQAASDRDAKRALVDSNEANVRRLHELQRFESITAPFDGIITVRNTDVGQLIQAGQNSQPNELFHIASIDKLRIYFSVPERYAAAIPAMTNVEISFDSLFSGQRFNGQIVHNANAIDPVSRTLNVEADVDNPSERLLPGAYASVHFKVPVRPDTVTIPANTLLFRAEGLRVAVVWANRASLRPITLGQDYGSTVEVITGLSTNDLVIVDPSDSLEDGDEIITGSLYTKH